jgi:hypothetical protein
MVPLQDNRKGQWREGVKVGLADPPDPIQIALTFNTICSDGAGGEGHWGRSGSIRPAMCCLWGPCSQ